MFKEVSKKAPKLIHQNTCMAYCQNFGKNSEICDISRFACQSAHCEIDYILLITYDDQIKLCRQMVYNKRQFKELKILLLMQNCQSKTPFKDS